MSNQRRKNEGEAVVVCRGCGRRRETENGVMPKVCRCGSGNFNVHVAKGAGHV